MGEEYEENNIKIKIESMEVKFAPSGKRILILGYRLKDGRYNAPKGYIWVGEGEDYKKIFSELINRYLDLRQQILKA